ncbi:MAG: alpha/beta hydrolase [Gemmatimonadota bacterium]
MRGEFLDVAGSRLYYYAAGSRGAGEPIVLIHGFPTSGHLWSDVVPALPPGHRVVVLDLLGYGRSDPAMQSPVDIGAHAERLVAVLDELRIARACLVGHGAGGGIAQSVAVRFPQRVSRLCLVNSVMFDEWPTWRGRFARALAPIARHLPPLWVCAAVHRMLAPGYVDREKGMRDIDLFLRPFEGLGGREALLSHLVQITSPATKPLSARLRDIKVPTAVVWGANDPYLSVHYGRALSQSIPGSTFDIVPGTRHFLPCEAALGVAAAVQKLIERQDKRSFLGH